jgi:hypothetical protein
MNMGGAWGLRRPVVGDPQGWFYYLWASNYTTGCAYRPTAGDQLRVWDEQDGTVYVGTIEEVRSFLYASHGEVSLALGGIRANALDYVQQSPSSGWCVAVRGNLVQAGTEQCPIQGQTSWSDLS